MRTMMPVQFWYESWSKDCVAFSGKDEKFSLIHRTKIRIDFILCIASLLKIVVAML
jgi:hypothetical protein